MAERLKKELLEQEKLVDLVAGPDSYRDLPNLLEQIENGQKAINVFLSKEETYGDIEPVRLHSNGVSAFVSIMRGCDNMCSFCVVPFTRGRERSRDLDSILDECQKLYDSGLIWNDLINKGYPHNGISWAVKNNKLKLRDASESQKLAWKSGKINPEIYRTEEYRKKKSKFGGLKEKSGRCKKYLYTKKDGTKVWLQGSWELNLAIFFDQKNIQWDKNKNGFPYKFENKDRKYYPDFYVSGKYIEVKGYQTNQDIEKWKQFHQYYPAP
jgi:hypothetical protein